MRTSSDYVLLCRDPKGVRGISSTGFAWVGDVVIFGAGSHDLPSSLSTCCFWRDSPLATLMSHPIDASEFFPARCWDR